MQYAGHSPRAAYFFIWPAAGLASSPDRNRGHCRHAFRRDPKSINAYERRQFRSETVRRKLEILIQKGWIRRDDRKYMTATDKANLAFLSLTKITQKYLRDLASALNRSS